MTHLQRSILSTLMILACSLAALAQGKEDARLAATVLAANPEGSPLRIVGFRLPATYNDAPKVIVQSLSSKQVRAFWVVAVVGRSDGLAAEFPKAGEGSVQAYRWLEERAILPHGKGEARESVLTSSKLAYLARSVNSTCLRIVVVIVRVEFDDGTEWDLGNHGLQMWKDSLPQGAGPCALPPGFEDTLRRLEGSGPEESSGLPTRLSSAQLESYSVSCSLREIRGRFLAMCPF